MSDQGNNNPSSSPSQWGTVFMSGGELNLSGVERSASTNWTPEDEAEYLKRVRARAEEMAAGMLESARAEAENIRTKAYEEGYNKGLEDSQRELDEFRAGMADSVSAVLSTIEGQCSAIFDQWRDDLVGVTQLAVERATGVVLNEDRKKALEAVLGQTVGILEDRRELSIRVNPEDEPVIADIMGLTQNKFPDIKVWRVKPDPTITPGGMMVESSSSLADGRVESRKAAIDQVISRLTLPVE